MLFIHQHLLILEHLRPVDMRHLLVWRPNNKGRVKEISLHNILLLVAFSFAFLFFFLNPSFYGWCVPFEKRPVSLQGLDLDLTPFPLFSNQILAKEMFRHDGCIISVLQMSWNNLEYSYQGSFSWSISVKLS